MISNDARYNVEINRLRKRLAELEAIVAAIPARLASYEMDEPHVDEPDSDGYYPAVPLDEWLAGEHCGDCTNEPSPCLRCEAEHITHKAAYLVAEAAAAGKTEGES